MATEQLPVTVLPSLPAAAESSAERLIAAFLAGRSPQTLRAYQGDLADFAAFAGASDVAGAATALLTAGHGGTNEAALRYRAHLLDRRLSPATINRRLAALRSLVALAKTLGMVPWDLCVPGLRAQSYRDTRGPGTAGFRKLLVRAEARADAKGVRDRAILRLLYDLALRRTEVCRLDVGDVDLAGGTVAVLGKGRAAKELLTLPRPTHQAFSAWLALRGPQPADAPLFVTLGRGRKAATRLTGDGIYYLVRYLGQITQVRARPHGLRHAGITRALDLAGGDVRKVQRYSRHKDLRTLNRYDDNRTDLADEVARMVAEDAA